MFQSVPMKVISIALVVFAALILVAGQQQPANVVADTQAAATCNTSTSKPSPTTATYHFARCIVAKFAAYFSLGQGRYFELKDGVVSNRSQCDSPSEPMTTPMLIINFGPCAQLEFEIAKQVNGTGVFVKAINGFVLLGNTTNTFSNSTALFHTTQSGHYYKCNTEQAVTMNKTDNVLVLSNFAYEAYRETTGTDFYQIPEECSLDSSQVSDLVRIGVGISLVALVVIVLVAYFVGRRRWSERSSYESV